ncbi:hypothetical protein DM02DRAFT_630909 [Periconia macrospinosa]|uniref:Uncharacterized protein n=1 Tax=Periconia macrospinosa TaxID=97972 RepID=A0A2V1DHS7_9PLEO|nr:hypothetical protein DM02DRAFT_630909 [Periconia macrospinosa]
MSCATDIAGIEYGDAVQRMQHEVISTIVNELITLQRKFIEAESGFYAACRKVFWAETATDLEAAEMESSMHISHGHDALHKYAEILDGIDYEAIYNMFDQAPDSEHLDKELLRTGIASYRADFEGWCDKVFEDGTAADWEHALNRTAQLIRGNKQIKYDDADKKRTRKVEEGGYWLPPLSSVGED